MDTIRYKQGEGTKLDVLYFDPCLLRNGKESTHKLCSTSHTYKNAIKFEAFLEDTTKNAQFQKHSSHNNLQIFLCVSFQDFHTIPL